MPPLVVVINQMLGSIVIQKRLNVLKCEDLAPRQLLVGLVIFHLFTGSMCRHNFGDVFLLFDARDEKRMAIEGNS